MAACRRGTRPRTSPGRRPTAPGGRRGTGPAPAGPGPGRRPRRTWPSRARWLCPSSARRSAGSWRTAGWHRRGSCDPPLVAPDGSPRRSLKRPPLEVHACPCVSPGRSSPSSQSPATWPTTPSAKRRTSWATCRSEARRCYIAASRDGGPARVVGPDGAFRYLRRIVATTRSDSAANVEGRIAHRRVAVQTHPAATVIVRITQVPLESARHAHERAGCSPTGVEARPPLRAVHD